MEDTYNALQFSCDFLTIVASKLNAGQPLGRKYYNNYIKV